MEYLRVHKEVIQQIPQARRDATYGQLITDSNTVFQALIDFLLLIKVYKRMQQPQLWDRQEQQTLSCANL